MLTKKLTYYVRIHVRWFRENKCYRQPSSLLQICILCTRTKKRQIDSDIFVWIKLIYLPKNICQYIYIYIYIHVYFQTWNTRDLILE